MKKVIDGCTGTIILIDDFDIEATNAISNAKNAEAALANVNVSKDQLAVSKKDNNRMFIIAFISAIVAILSSLPELLTTIKTLFFNA